MRNPKGKPVPAKKAKKGKAKKKAVPKAAASMELDTAQQQPEVWLPGMEPLGEDEELEYDLTAYDCLHPFSLEWPCLSFDVLHDTLGGPRTTFPHTLQLAAGTQAATASANCVALLHLAGLGQGRHGKKKRKGEGEAAEEDEDEDDSLDGSEDDEAGEDEAQPEFRSCLVAHAGGVNRLRSMPQKPGVLAVWGDTGQVKVYDLSSQRAALGAPTWRAPKAGVRLQVKPLHAHSHAMEGYAMDWSRTTPGRLVTGDCRKSIHVWEPSEDGRWSVGGAFAGHSGSVEDLQWSPTEATVFASASVDHTLRIWDTRERSKSMLSVQAHDSDVNVLSWNRLVTYLLATGGDDGVLKIWDLRTIGGDPQPQPVSLFTFHRSAVTSLEWSPYESSMLVSTGDDNQLGVWDLALERDPEEEAALVAEGSAAAPRDLPAQLLFVHAGQTDLKEAHWHDQIPGLILSTALDGFNVFKPSNL